MLFIQVVHADAQNELIIIDLDNVPAFHLTGIGHTELSGDVLKPRYVHAYDTLLVFIESSVVEDQIVKLFSLDNFEKLGYYGRRGRGPGEIVFAAQMLPQDIQDHFSILDWGRKRVVDLNIETILRGDHYYEPENTFTLPPRYIRLQHAVMVGDSLVIGIGDVPEGKLTYINRKDNTEIITPLIPDINFHFLRPRAKEEAYSSTFAIHKEYRKVILANAYFCQLEIYNLKGELQKTIQIRDNNNKCEKQAFDHEIGASYKDSFVFYPQVTISRDYIYALFQGESAWMLWEGLDGDADPAWMALEPWKNVHSEVHVFDWEGQIVGRYVLDQLIDRIAIDEINHQIIGINIYTEESIIIYDMNVN